MRVGTVIICDVQPPTVPTREKNLFLSLDLGLLYVVGDCGQIPGRADSIPMVEKRTVDYRSWTWCRTLFGVGKRILA